MSGTIVLYSGAYCRKKIMVNSVQNNSVTAILLAAGESTRMGQLKALMPWENGVLIEFQIAELLSGGVVEVIVVVGASYEKITPFVNKFRSARTVFNPNFKNGKTTSIKIGVRAMGKRINDILVIGVDQPRPSRVIRDLIGYHQSTSAPITVPVHNDARGHPLLFRQDLLDDINEIQEESLGLRQVLKKWDAEIAELSVESPIVLMDLNTPAEYTQAERLFKNS